MADPFIGGGGGGGGGVSIYTIMLYVLANISKRTLQYYKVLVVKRWQSR